MMLYSMSLLYCVRIGTYTCNFTTLPVHHLREQRVCLSITISPYHHTYEVVYEHQLTSTRPIHSIYQQLAVRMFACCHVVHHLRDYWDTMTRCVPSLSIVCSYHQLWTRPRRGWRPCVTDNVCENVHGSM